MGKTDFSQSLPSYETPLSRFPRFHARKACGEVPLGFFPIETVDIYLNNGVKDADKKASLCN
ncbi:MAG: hypothetical protein IJW38_04725 [Clostridia bacterium]|nr:hypothetical protein [Clostridia bacterium]